MSIQVTPLGKTDVVSYVGSFIKSLLNFKKLDLSETNFHSYEQVFQIPKPTFEVWQSTLSNKDKFNNYNTFYSYLNTDAFFATVGKLGIDFKTILHLSADISFHDENFQFEPLENYTYKARVEDILPYPSKNKAILKLRIEIYHRDELKITHVDKFFFRGVPKNLYSTLVASKQTQDEFSGLSRKQSELVDDGARSTKFKVSNKMGVKYGLLSGDLNPLHTVTLVSKMAKHPKSFVQGLCSVNLALAILKDRFDIDLGQFHCKFVSPVFCGEEYFFLEKGERFEIIDKEGQLKVAGSFKKTAPLFNHLSLIS